MLGDFLLGRVAVSGQQRRGLHDLTRLTVTALAQLFERPVSARIVHSTYLSLLYPVPLDDLDLAEAPARSSESPWNRYGRLRSVAGGRGPRASGASEWLTVPVVICPVAA